jgi:hypothetical protein
MHYSQLRSAVESSVESGHGDSDVLRVHLQGFIDVGVLDERIGELTQRIEQHTPGAVLCDLRAVAGYGPGTPTLAREWLMLARRAGIRRVALVATSSVLRTAALMLARDLDLQLRCFLGETEALRWLSAKN